MRFFIVDDDEAVRSMLSEIIEDYDLGEVVGEAENGSVVNSQLLTMKAVDILIIDLLMPIRDGIQTVHELKKNFFGKIVMLSQVVDKEMIGNAYLQGIHYYITKPINRLEVVSVIQNAAEHLRLQQVLSTIETNLNRLNVEKNPQNLRSLITHNKSIITSGQYLLTELGMIGENGCKDLLEILEYLNNLEFESPSEHEFPSLKDIFTGVAKKRVGLLSDLDKIRKESKAIEQRVRRAIFQGLNHMAALGITDYTNSKFEEYAPNFFDFTEVRKIMFSLKNDTKISISDSHINIKRFVKVLFLESKKRTIN